MLFDSEATFGQSNGEEVDGQIIDPSNVNAGASKEVSQNLTQTGTPSLAMMTMTTIGHMSQQRWKQHLNHVF